MKAKMPLLLVTTSALLFSPAHLKPTSAQPQTGVASVYSTESGSKTASGQKLNPAALTAAHRTLPLGSKVRVTKDRGRFLESDFAPAVTVTVHPSSILRIDDDEERHQARADLTADLRKVARRLARS